ncbi:MAG TPA: hypothetical protein VGQ49_11080 [Bryobacteraceae bacterium]|jgi:hypothetical protein|nr:hypothetical protein [Bryobacteraceae bacterium]
MKTTCSLVLALALGGLTGCVRTPPGPHIDPALASLIPPDTILLAGARLDQLQKTGIYQKHLANRAVPLIDDFPKQIGLKVRRQDLWELLLISDGRQSIVLGRGKFSDEAEPRIEIPGSTRFAYKGYNLVGDERQAVLLVSPSVIGFGPTAALRSMIDNKGKSNGPPANLADQLKGMPAESIFWAAYGGGVTRLPFNMPGDMANLNKIIASIQSGSIYLDLRTGINGLATGNCGSDQDAKGLYDALRGLAGLGRLAIPKDKPEVGRILDGLRITQDAHTVNIHIEEPEELVGSLLDLWLGQAN